MSLSSRVTAVVAYCLLFCALATAVIGGLGVIGVRAAMAAQTELTTDELATATITSTLAHQIDRAYAEGQGTALTADRVAREVRAAELRNTQIPAVERTLSSVQTDPCGRGRRCGRAGGHRPPRPGVGCHAPRAQQRCVDLE